MRTNLIRRERKSGYRLVSFIHCGKLTSSYPQLFRNKNVVLCSFLSSFCLSDNSKLGSSSSLASRNNLVRILRNTRGLPCSGFPVPYLHNPIFAPHLHLPRFLSHTGLVFGKMGSLFCSEYPRFLRYRFSSESSQVRDVSVLLDLISSIFHFCYNVGRKESAYSRECRTKEIYCFRLHLPNNIKPYSGNNYTKFQTVYSLCFHLAYLRGLNRNLSLQTKFYSYPRRPLFLGALGKAKALLAPRACLKTMLLQAFTSRFIAWSQYLCIAKFSSHLFRTRSGRIGQRRCFLFLRAADCPKMIGENGGTKC